MKKEPSVLLKSIIDKYTRELERIISDDITFMKIVVEEDEGLGDEDEL